MYRVVKKSFKGDMLQLSEETQTDEQAKWFFLTPAVQKFAVTIKKGDSIDVVTEDKGDKKYISRINTGKGSAERTPTAEAPTKTWSKPASTWGQKSPEESEKISRLSLLSSTATIVASLGLKDTTEVLGAIDVVYEKLYGVLKATPLSEDKKEEPVV